MYRKMIIVESAHKDILCNEIDEEYILEDIKRMEIDAYGQILDVTLESKNPKTKKKLSNKKPKKEFNEPQITNQIKLFNKCSKCGEVTIFAEKFKKDIILNKQLTVQDFFDEVYDGISICDCGGFQYLHSYEIIEGEELIHCETCPFPGKCFPENAINNDFNCILDNGEVCKFNEERKKQL